MANHWYLGPCCCEEELYLLIYEITPHLDRAGVSFHVPERTGDFSSGDHGPQFLSSHRREIGEAIAKIIIKADGREFVPVTRGEYLNQAVSLGLFPRNTDWGAPLTKGEAAVLAVKLMTMLGRG